MSEIDLEKVADLVEDAIRYHGAPWRRVVSSDMGSFYGVMIEPVRWSRIRLPWQL